jgi:CBS domain containing-hemolysin-like protein
VIEEIFGEIEDEHDNEDWLEEKISEKEYLFSGRVDIDYINEVYHLALTKSEQYETLAGLIIHTLESIPEVGTKLDLEKFNIIIEQVSDRKIEIVRIIVK